MISLSHHLLTEAYNNAWANHRLLKVCAQLSQEEFAARRVFQHQTHHRGQVRAMLSGTHVTPPQLDEFFSAGEAPLRAQDFAELGWTEETIWR